MERVRDSVLAAHVFSMLLTLVVIFRLGQQSAGPLALKNRIKTAFVFLILVAQGFVLNYLLARVDQRQDPDFIRACASDMMGHFNRTTYL
jgi:hypothetical protein